MAYPYYGGYQNPYYPAPMPDNLAQLRQQPAQTPQTGMIWIQGETGAKSYMVAPGNTVALWDSENPTIYIKSCDNSGMPSMRIIDYVERTQKPSPAPAAAPAPEYVTRQEFDALAAKFEAMATKPAKKNAKEAEQDG